MAKAKLTSYQRFVVFAAWLGLAFDLMDALLFTFVSPSAIPSLLHIPANGPGTRQLVTQWTGIITSIMLLGWAIGGIVFGRLADRIGRSRVMIVTMLIYTLGTGACAFAPTVGLLAFFRFVAALGIGGEWAAGATLVAETVPEERRVGMGTLLATSGMAGNLVAMLLSHLGTRGIDVLARNPDLGWRVVMAAGAIPAVVAMLLRRSLREPEQWKHKKEAAPRALVRELFTPSLLRRTMGGVLVSIVTFVTLWILMAFLPAIATGMVEQITPRPPPSALSAARGVMITKCLLAFNAGNILGAAIATPIALRLGRRPLFLLGFGTAGGAFLLAFGPSWPTGLQIFWFAIVAVPLGLLVAAFQFYLTELFPLQVRTTGASFCATVGRFATVFGPIAVGIASTRWPVTTILSAVSAVPLVGLVFVLTGLVVETKGESLRNADALLGEAQPDR